MFHKAFVTSRNGRMEHGCWFFSLQKFFLGVTSRPSCLQTMGQQSFCFLASHHRLDNVTIQIVETIQIRSRATLKFAALKDASRAERHSGLHAVTLMYVPTSTSDEILRVWHIWNRAQGKVRPLGAAPGGHVHLFPKFIAAETGVGPLLVGEERKMGLKASIDTSLDS